MTSEYLFCYSADTLHIICISFTCRWHLQVVLWTDPPGTAQQAGTLVHITPHSLTQRLTRKKQSPQRIEDRREMCQKQWKEWQSKIIQMASANQPSHVPKENGEGGRKPFQVVSSHATSWVINSNVLISLNLDFVALVVSVRHEAFRAP